MDKGELMRFVKDCDLLGDHDNGVPFLTRNELDLMFIRANWDGPMGRALAPSVTLSLSLISGLSLSLSLRPTLTMLYPMTLTTQARWGAT